MGKREPEVIVDAEGYVPLFELAFVMFILIERGDCSGNPT